MSFTHFTFNRSPRGGLGLVTLVALCSLLFFFQIDERGVGAGFGLAGGTSLWDVLPISTQGSPKPSSSTEDSQKDRVSEHPNQSVLYLSYAGGEDGWKGIETRYLNESSVHGFSMFERLYLVKGTFYIVTSAKASVDFPPLRNVIAKPLDIGQGLDMEPTSKEMQIIHPADIRPLFGQHALWIHDTSVIIYDPPQYLNHYYHWWGEIMLGIWRIFSAWSVRYNGGRPLTPPARFILPFTNTSTWGDHANVNSPLMRMAFPGMAMEKASYWKDLQNLNMPVVFERAMLVNRETAHRHTLANQWGKMIGGAMSINVPTQFFESFRRRVVINLLGYLPILHSDPPSGSDPILSEHEPMERLRPLVTYISRQGGGRRLTEVAHTGLIEALEKLQDEGVCDIVVAQMERMKLVDQIALAAKSTIILGVHGNGLTHVLWMPPSNRSTVIEIFSPSGFLFDYEMLARNMGHKHYAVWNDTLITYPPGTYHEGPNWVEGFNGDDIPVYGPAVADVIRERLTMGI
ncbi:hypothetical protein BDN72DRAFT_674442 [Pluteus cervinus]|uniref:Uncharacterized protein n=1 Tax=Pluteus cervinus TaxID=181527 RepID=A0ACD3AS31_9AGAR|nr:hypothetical protein BDN72DRAFT_674442 [Pluteus cervinus]